jgi:branched-chain amino acid transport system substrate-binding protein
MRRFSKPLLARHTFLAGAAALPVAARAQGPAPLKIGVMFGYSGDNAASAKLFDAAVAAYMRRHGDTIAGRPVQLIKRDTGNPDPETIRRVASDLILNDKVKLILGLTFSPEVIAMGPISTQTKMPVFNVNSSTSNIIKDAPYISRYGITNGQMVYPLADWASKQGIRSIYIMVSDYVAGISCGQEFAKAFQAKGGQIAGELRVPLFAKDFTPYVTRLADAKPEALFIFLPSGSGPLQFLQTLHASPLAHETRVLGVGSVVEEDTLDIVADEAIGLITSYDYSMSHDSPLNRQFVADFQAAAGAKLRPNYAAIGGYDALGAIYTVVQAQKGDVDPDRTMQLVRGLRLQSPRGPLVVDPGTRDVVQNVYIRRTEKRAGAMVNAEIVTYPSVKDPTETYG